MTTPLPVLQPPGVIACAASILTQFLLFKHQRSIDELLDDLPLFGRFYDLEMEKGREDVEGALLFSRAAVLLAERRLISSAGAFTIFRGHLLDTPTLSQLRPLQLGYGRVQGSRHQAQDVAQVPSEPRTLGLRAFLFSASLPPFILSLTL